MLPEVTATRYIAPLRSGGSVPGIVEADDLGTYVVKFTGSAQGRKALVAEVIVGELARALGLRFPELVLVRFDPAVADNEPHQEVRELHAASAGVNLGMDYLPGARDFTPEVARVFPVDPLEAGRIVWLDALTVNVDRTVHSSNLMVWPTLGVAPPRLWLIDHGAALVFHHRWDGSDPARAYDFRHHALGHYGPDVRAADAELAPRVTEELLRRILGQVPDPWLADEPGFATPDAAREAYVAYLHARVRSSEAWLPTGFPSREELAAEEALRAARNQQGRPAWLKQVPDLHGKPAARQDWSVHLG
ncbi:aminotransferase class I and II [Streptomyces viridochromogenes DSM 40736]|uniref:Aminotransferase class I and II n=1 Tax=Streptomyces viridochromogenes (strain DSM 40736 / JCM 4977 / BCRC 1201 / Tue 494) TaxID=591159 RepID=D9X315_STRVT|nr:HipA family kinase [Streptomyces viridochromogenes]EFL35852.1 aminotransferase class I and II [Streptomyces viridochromogenes DSM 40736]